MGSELLFVKGLLMPLNNPLRQVLLLSLLCRGHTAGQGGRVTCPRWHSWNLAPGFDPSSSGERKEARVPVAATACPACSRQPFFVRPTWTPVSAWEQFMIFSSSEASVAKGQGQDCSPIPAPPGLAVRWWMTGALLASLWDSGFWHPLLSCNLMSNQQLRSPCVLSQTRAGQGPG